MIFSCIKPATQSGCNIWADPLTKGLYAVVTIEKTDCNSGAKPLLSEPFIASNLVYPPLLNALCYNYITC